MTIQVRSGRRAHLQQLIHRGVYHYGSNRGNYAIVLCPDGDFRTATTELALQNYMSKNPNVAVIWKNIKEDHDGDT